MMTVKAKASSASNLSVLLFKSITIILGLTSFGLGWTAIVSAKEVMRVGEGIHLESEQDLVDQRVLEENIFLFTSGVFLFISVVNISFEFMTDLRKGWTATADKMYHLIFGIFVCLGNFLLIHATKMQDNFYNHNYDHKPTDEETWTIFVRQNINYREKLVAGSLGFTNGLICFLGGILTLRSGLHPPKMNIDYDYPHTLHL